MRFYTGIASVVFFKYSFYINQTIYTIYYVLERIETCHVNFKNNWKEKTMLTLNLHDEFLLILMILWIGLLNEGCRSFRYIAHKILIYFYNLGKITEQVVKKISCLEKQYEIICLEHLLKLGIVNVESF